MVPDEGQPTAPEQSQNVPAPLKGGPRRSRRGGRRHSKPRGPRPPGQPLREAGSESSLPAIEEAERRQQPEVESRPARRPERERDDEPITPSLATAIEQVNKVIDELRHSLDEMEEVLETLELAERQKIDDEREIESLQRALRQLHRPAPGAVPPRR
ncbi:MAG: hypothetical protein QOD03_1245 [Verrucomicrobiota bacterium]